jgi:threonine/homoserine efflux transporter RhtA
VICSAIEFTHPTGVAIAELRTLAGDIRLAIGLGWLAVLGVAVYLVLRRAVGERD